MQEGRGGDVSAKPRTLLAALLVGLLFAARPAHTAEPPCAIDGVERVVAVGDVHGAHDRLVAILRAAGLIDGRQRWSGGRAHLVQLGDVVDRGPDSRKALDLLRRLEDQAKKAGGAVHALLGNHEVMRMAGDQRYVAPGEYEAFRTPRSADVRDFVLQRVSAEEREALRQATPLGWIEMRAAFAPDGTYGRWLRRHHAVVRINGVVFLHGGISPALAAMGCEEINATVRREISGDLPATGLPGGSLATREDGPLWYRGLAREADAFAPALDLILQGQKARAIVIAHTVVPEGRIVTRFGGKVVQIDTGMQSAYSPKGRPSSLEIRGDTFTAIYEDGRQVLAPWASPSAPGPSRGN